MALRKLFVLYRGTRWIGGGEPGRVVRSNLFSRPAQRFRIELMTHITGGKLKHDCLCAGFHFIAYAAPGDNPAERRCQ